MSFKFHTDIRQAKQKEWELESLLQYEGWYTSNTSQAGVFSGYDIKTHYPPIKVATTLEQNL